MFKVELKLKNGEYAILGDIIKWHSTDDERVFTCIGMYRNSDVVYLSGSVDFSLAIGKRIDTQLVIDDAINNNELEQGIEKIGVAKDMAIHIAKFNG